MVNYADEHEAYAASRGKEYVYVSNNEHHEQALNDFVDGVENIPLVVVGKRESGKSSLLSNWLRKRKIESPNDFFFVHFSGCSPQNFHLQRMLFRLETALKTFFNLRGSVPKTEEKLRWGLNRFLEAAAKKELPAKIIIIIDGANSVLSEDNPPGKLHWLPTKMPSCVRFILSTVQFDEPVTNHDSPTFRNHRTYTELVKRRQCPTLKLDALKLNTRLQIIKSFSEISNNMCHQPCRLSDDQFLKIAKSKHSSQPFYLRLVLTALCLGRDISKASIDEQLDQYTSSKSIKHLLAQILHACAAYVEPERKGGNSILYFVLSILHASRQGLTDDEIWGLIEFKHDISLQEDVKQRIQLILKKFCMTVNGCHLFSHSFFQDAFFDFYINSSSTYIQLHNIMAAYFETNMVLCDRKLSCLVWHLEVSGSWKRLKNILVDVENFHLWWTHHNKDEFIELWSSLTQSPQISHFSTSTLITGVYCAEWMKCNQHPRPFYDPVEEYTKSIESHRSKFGMSDEYLTGTLLKVSDFLLEFAVLGREKRADVPNFHHPNVSNEEMQRLGVPYLDNEDGGRSVLMFPKHGKSNDHIGSISSEEDVMTTLSNDAPTYSAYMFRRWMWIYFPVIALRNCEELNDHGNKNEEHINDISSEFEHIRSKTTSTVMTVITSSEQKDEKIKKENIHSNNSDRPKTSSKTAPVKKKVAKRVPMLASNVTSEKGIMDMLSKLKTQYDYLVGKKMKLTRSKQKYVTEYHSLQGDTLDMDDRNQKLAYIQKRIEKTEKNKLREENLHKNYYSVLKSCNENPAHNRALIKQFETKLEEDSYLIEQCTRLIGEVMRDTQNQLDGQRHMNRMMAETKHLYKSLLDNRTQDRDNIVSSIDEDDDEDKTMEESAKFLKGLIGRGGNAAKARTRAKSSETMEDSEIANDVVDEMKTLEYLKIEEKLKQRTSFCNLTSFASRLIHSQAEARDQIEKIKSMSEARITALGDEVESKKEELRVVTEKVGKGNGLEGKELNEREASVSSSVTNMQKWEEKAETSENLLREIRHGIESIGVTLGISFFSSQKSTLDILVKVQNLLMLILQGSGDNNNESSTKVAHTAGAGSLGTIAEDSDSSSVVVTPRNFDEAMAAFNTNRIKIASRIQGGPPKEAGAIENREERSELYGRRQMIKANSRDILNQF